MVEVFLAEFGTEPTNIENLKKYFDSVTVENNLPLLFDGPREGWRMNDYWKVKLLLEAKDIGIAFDGDMHVYSDRVLQIVPLIRKFGICLPANPRYLVEVDASIGADGGDVEIGTGYALNCGIIGLDTHNKRAVKLVNKYLEIMLREPCRGPLAWWRAIWETGITPYLLPPQWCVCKEDIGIGNEIILHGGHEEVKQHYSNLCN